MVRLKAPDPAATGQTGILFQFQHGSIKSVIDISFDKTVPSFQFQHGSIKSH